MQIHNYGASNLIKLFFFCITQSLPLRQYLTLDKIIIILHTNLKYYNTVTVDMFLHSSIYLTHKAYKQLIILAATKT